jgi:alkylhydroperoxidase/carboxymuconolactone decarboxylase family protein YurZ
VLAVTKGQYDLSVRRMIEWALQYGFSQTEIMEVGMQLAFYIGVLPARSFMHIAIRSSGRLSLLNQKTIGGK